MMKQTLRLNKHWILKLCLTLLIGLAAGAARADGGAQLTVTPVGAPAIVFTADELLALGETRLDTETPWTDGKQAFVGITGRQLLDALKARGVDTAAVSVTAIANNDYQILIPRADFDQDALLIAIARNGAAMPVRDKGPFWIVFPYDQDPKYNSTTYKSYSIWGLERLEFRAQ